MVGNKVVELMTSRSETGKLGEKVDSYEETIIQWKKRAEALNKRVADLQPVNHRRPSLPLSPLSSLLDWTGLEQLQLPAGERSVLPLGSLLTRTVHSATDNLVVWHGKSGVLLLLSNHLVIICGLSWLWAETEKFN